MDKHYYYTGTDYTTMGPWHWDFYYHMLVPWTWHNWVWLTLGVLVLIVKFNDDLIRHKEK